MKYKKHIATGALAISLLVGGTSVFAATPQDLGIKNTNQVYQKQNKNSKTKTTQKNKEVGTISLLNNAGFTIEVKNLKTKITNSIEIVTNNKTTYSKNGLITTASDLAVGQKVIITGILDRTVNILTAKTVKIVN